MTDIDPAAARLLRSRVQSERERTVRSLRNELVLLKHKLDSAIARLDAGEGLDAHLIHNSQMITADIAKWNLLRDIAPMLADQGTPEPSNGRRNPASTAQVDDDCAMTFREAELERARTIARAAMVWERSTSVQRRKRQLVRPTKAELDEAIDILNRVMGIR